MKVEFKIQKIIYNPLSYIHKDRLDIPYELTTTPLSRSAANAFLIEALGLEKKTEHWGKDVYFWVNVWDLLPDITYLLGFYLYGNLIWCGNTIKVPSWVKGFSFEKDSVLQMSVEKPRQHKDLYIKGYGYLSNFYQQLPLSLRQRVPLLFPGYVDQVKPVGKADVLLLSMAVQYVKKNISKA